MHASSRFTPRHSHIHQPHRTFLIPKPDVAFTPVSHHQCIIHSFTYSQAVFHFAFTSYSYYSFSFPGRGLNLFDHCLTTTSKAPQYLNFEIGAIAEDGICKVFPLFYSYDAEGGEGRSKIEAVEVDARLLEHLRVEPNLLPSLECRGNIGRVYFETNTLKDLRIFQTFTIGQRRNY
ncbi:uncharacterized protein BDR25DRAFT_353170 [Lindgomyces ingoldianus]|uniref:Uncharacterized protein n=1 Tax=Lindgomyces ingoldianus TaxID=673940 RepID=A0ACB6R3E3_9PLEO|nr:uncharacterized protein BDR25DRAFT_353170 [Lindgomyces ingoldianus]KAF2472850.1 hypothetical protein BDR25DRAFT_353170 [Lindgomyces ingoldianus]